MTRHRPRVAPVERQAARLGAPRQAAMLGMPVEINLSKPAAVIIPAAEKQNSLHRSKHLASPGAESEDGIVAAVPDVRSASKRNRLHSIAARAKINIAPHTHGRFSHEPVTFSQLTADAKSRIREVTPTQANEEQAQGAVLIDVRESEEFAQGHAQGRDPPQQGTHRTADREAVPDAATPIICYCGGGSARHSRPTICRRWATRMSRRCPAASRVGATKACRWQ